MFDYNTAILLQILKFCLAIKKFVQAFSYYKYHKIKEFLIMLIDK